MIKKTKIVATISDLKCDDAFLRELFDAGVNVVRLNTAHQDEAGSLKVIESVRNISEKVPLMIDTKGPEIRTTKVEGEINVKSGDKVIMKGGKDKISTSECVYVNYNDFAKDLSVGDDILIDDGELGLKVINKTEDSLVCEVQNEGVIKGKKSVNVPGVHISLPSLSERDLEYIKFSIDNNIDFIAHSFVRNKEDVLAIQKILDDAKSTIKIIAKIENQEGVDNIDEILDHVYGIMVARGDLGIEIPAERIPGIQKMLIRKSIERKRAVITATQMLHTMIKNPRPTRAEVSDIANAIYDGTDAIMLSGETSYGEYPIEAVKIMSKIAREVENNKNAYKDIAVKTINNEISAFLAKAAVTAPTKLPIKAIIVDTMTGRTARYLAAFRGKIPVYAMCYDKKVMRELGLYYGVKTSYMEPQKTNDKFVENSLKSLVDRSKLTEEDMVLILAGSFGANHGASFIEISTVKSILNQGKN
ncbi:pyruvate kinase [Candidatus Woesearchaeota archaeon]|nr:pyruvate kinase [Candidatus Woesearchaeota archaeon]